ncbi:uncharacterized protein BJX67DRAFT_381610 [Aspergillus lucknowensis]|uniref:Heterokaryon incompatibility domain-containing protein n=1 Tax=Aspergillus lucknowensis TaxID=176173 RepID=A0ABR4LQ54_9EURO
MGLGYPYHWGVDDENQVMWMSTFNNTKRRSALLFVKMSTRQRYAAVQSSTVGQMESLERLWRAARDTPGAGGQLSLRRYDIFKVNQYSQSKRLYSTDSSKRSARAPQLQQVVATIPFEIICIDFICLDEKNGRPRNGPDSSSAW